MKKLIFIMLLSFQGILFAQQTAQPIINTFFNTYHTNQEKAIRDLYSTNSWMQYAQKEIDNVVITVNGLKKELVGDYLGKEFVNSESLAKCFSTYTYLVKYERQPVKFVFTFYKPQDRWVLYAFSLSDDF
jgi:hypothetical protein